MLAIDLANDNAHNPIFHECTRSTITTKRIMGIITVVTKKPLFAKKKYFSWLDIITGEYDYNLLTILYILIAVVNPNIPIRATDLKAKMCLAKMGAFNHDVRDLLTEIKANYNLIINEGFTHNDIIMDAFNALLKSKNRHLIHLLNIISIFGRMGNHLALMKSQLI